MFKKIIYSTVIFGFVLIACEKSDVQKVIPTYGAFSTSDPLQGLVITPTSHLMLDMLDDIDPNVKSENENMNIVALAFQEIVCDPAFETALGNELDDDREFDVRMFLTNNSSFESTIQSWMTANGHSYNDVFGINSIKGPWAYACNYGVHSTGAPVLAISVDLDSAFLGEFDDFVPCYYSPTECGVYEVGLVGFESDLGGPEDPNHPTKNLIIIFETSEDISNKTINDLGNDSDYTGSLVSSGGTSPACEKADHYNLEDFKVTLSYNKSKKMKIRTCTYISNEYSPYNTYSLCEFSSENLKRNRLKGYAKDIVGVFTPPKSFDGRTIFGANFYGPASTKYANHWGILFESDWYSCKKHHKMKGNSGCSFDIIFKARMKHHEELYAGFYFYGDWCKDDVYRFTNLAGIGDQGSWVDIKNSTTYNLTEY